MSKFIGHFWRNVLLYIELLVDIFSFNILNMQSRSLWPTGFVLRTLTTLVKIPCMWWVTLLLFNHLSLCAQSLWIYFTWSLLKSLYLYIRTFCQIWESGVISLNQLAVCFPLYSPSAVTAAAKSLLLCPTLCDPIDSSPLGSSVPRILQTRIPEWVAISFFNAWKWKVKVKLLSHARLLANPWTAAYQAPPSMGFSRQEYWSGVLLPSPILLLGLP